MKTSALWILRGAMLVIIACVLITGAVIPAHAAAIPDGGSSEESSVVRGGGVAVAGPCPENPDGFYRFISIPDPALPYDGFATPAESYFFTCTPPVREGNKWVFPDGAIFYPSPAYYEPSCLSPVDFFVSDFPALEVAYSAAPSWICR